MAEIEDNFDLSEFKTIDENGETQEIELNSDNTEEEKRNEALTDAAEELEKETEVVPPFNDNGGIFLCPPPISAADPDPDDCTLGDGSISLRALY